MEEIGREAKREGRGNEGGREGEGRRMRTSMEFSHVGSWGNHTAKNTGKV